MKEESFIRKNKGRRIAKQFEREIRIHNLINSEKREDYLVLADVLRRCRYIGVPV